MALKTETNEKPTPHHPRTSRVGYVYIPPAHIVVNFSEKWFKWLAKVGIYCYIDYGKPTWQSHSSIKTMALYYSRVTFYQF